MLGAILAIIVIYLLARTRRHEKGYGNSVMDDLFGE